MTAEKLPRKLKNKEEEDRWNPGSSMKRLMNSWNGVGMTQKW